DSKEAGYFTVTAQHFSLGQYHLYAECADEMLFTENETNCVRLYGSPNDAGYVKDAFHEYMVNGKREAVNPAKTGTKAAAHYTLKIARGETATSRRRLSESAGEAGANPESRPFEDFDQVFEKRLREADRYFEAFYPPNLREDLKLVE